MNQEKPFSELLRERENLQYWVGIWPSVLSRDRTCWGLLVSRVVPANQTKSSIREPVREKVLSFFMSSECCPGKTRRIHTNKTQVRELHRFFRISSVFQGKNTPSWGLLVFFRDSRAWTIQTNFLCAHIVCMECMHTLKTLSTLVKEIEVFLLS